MTFSVIIPCFNAEKTIVRALDSVVNQSCRDFEIIIVNDGSNDNTESIIKKYFENKDIKYKYIYQDNKGPSSARNNAVKNSRAEYLAFLDSDDEWHLEKLQIQYDEIIKSKIRFVSTKYTTLDFKINNKRVIKEYKFEDFLISNRTSTPCTIVEKELFEEVGGFDESMSYSEDYNLWLKISLIEPLYLIEQELVKLHKKPYGESGLSSNLWSMEKGEIKNYTYFYKNKYIGIVKYLFMISFSIVKYFRRLIYANF
jgi:glycosyltransferase involved in cell wall biosynthesis